MLAYIVAHSIETFINITIQKVADYPQPFFIGN